MTMQLSGFVGVLAMIAYVAVSGLLGLAVARFAEVTAYFDYGCGRSTARMVGIAAGIGAAAWILSGLTVTA
jgi:hypothetical protein